MMASATQDFTVVIGGSFDPPFAFKQSGNPLSLVGWSFALYIDRVATLTPGSGLTVDAANGVVQALLSPNQTQAVRPGPYKWYLKTTDAGGSVNFPMKGTITFEEPI